MRDSAAGAPDGQELLKTHFQVRRAAHKPSRFL
jgi:hypothetical protein